MIKLILWLLWPSKLQDAEFNFSEMKVYSVERNGDRTVICHFSPKGKKLEWFAYCPLSTHERLLKSFRETIIKPV